MVQCKCAAPSYYWLHPHTGAPDDGCNEITTTSKKLIMDIFAQRPIKIQLCVPFYQVSEQSRCTYSTNYTDLQCRTINPTSHNVKLLMIM